MINLLSISGEFKRKHFLCWLPFHAAEQHSKKRMSDSAEHSERGATFRCRPFFVNCAGQSAFGGPAAHIAMLEQEVVGKRKWMTQEHFLDLVGATNIIPGPNSTEMVIHCGYHRAGWPGLILGGLSFILPATLLTGMPSKTTLGDDVLWALGRQARENPEIASILGRASWPQARALLQQLDQGRVFVDRFEA